jgi:hypothetical protein
MVFSVFFLKRDKFVFVFLKGKKESDKFWFYFFEGMREVLCSHGFSFCLVLVTFGREFG